MRNPSLSRLVFCIACCLFLSVAMSSAASAPDDAPRISWGAGAELAKGGGERGPWQQNDSRYDYVDDPGVAIDERGEIGAAWVEQAKKDVFFQRIASDGSKRGAPVNVSRSPATFSWLPRVVIPRRDPQKVFIVWQEIIFSGASHGGEIFFARSDDGGGTFAAPVNVSRLVGGDGKGRITKDVWHNGSFDLAVAPDGVLSVAWTDYDGTLWFSRSTDGGRMFSPAHGVAGSKSLPARAPALALGPGRTVYLAWTVGEDRSADIRVARADDGAAFGEPLIVGRSKGYSDAPRLAVDPAGVLHLVYAESADGPFDRYHLRHARSTDGARSFDAPRALPGTPGAGGESTAFPALAIDDRGNLYVLAELYPDHRSAPRGLGLTVSRDGGRSFSRMEMVPGSVDPGGGFNGSHQGLLMQKLAVNGGGAVAIGNSALKAGAYSRVWLITGQAGAR